MNLRENLAVLGNIALSLLITALVAYLKSKGYTLLAIAVAIGAVVSAAGYVIYTDHQGR